MKLLTILFSLAVATVALAGRPTPLGDSNAQILTVTRTLPIASKVLSVRLVDAQSLHYIVEYSNYDEEFCRALGYNLTLVERDPLTAAPTYKATPDGARRGCVVSE